MPDHSDYERLSELLENPRDWSAKEYWYVDALLREAEQSLEETPASYREARDRLERSIIGYKRAIDQYHDVRGGSAPCRCHEIHELRGLHAKRYADRHLNETQVRASGWEVGYTCPVTGAEWLEDWPDSTSHGGGIMRLRRTDALT